jgi:hypothetical protein
MRTRRILAALAAGIAAIFGVVVVPATPAFAATYTTYVSILTPSGHIGPSVIDMWNWSTADFARAQLWILRTSGDVTNQRWRINRVAGTSTPFGKFQFANVNSGKCLTANGFSFDSIVMQFSCYAGNNNQWWKAVPVSTVDSNWVELVNMGNNTCLDARGYGYGDGVPLQTYACHGDWNQRFNPYP